MCYSMEKRSKLSTLWNSHLIDAVRPLEGALLDLSDLVPAHVEHRQVGDPVEEAEGRDPGDLVVGEDEVGGGGRDARGDVLGKGAFKGYGVVRLVRLKDNQLGGYRKKRWKCFYS